MNATARVKTIAVIQGAPSLVIQGLLREFVSRHARDANIVGVIEEPPGVADGEAAKAPLRDIRGGGRYQIFQDLGSGSTACGLDAGGVVSASEVVRRQIATGCDLVVLTKFAQLEADRGGLAPAFAAAIEAGAPVLTAVAPKFAAMWDAFAGPFYEILPPSPEAIEAWWRALSAGDQAVS